MHAGVAELADAQDLKSWVPRGACGFDPRPRHDLRSRSARAEGGAQARARRRFRPRPSGVTRIVGFEQRPNWYIEFVAGTRTVRETTKFTKRPDAAEFLKKRISESTSRYS